MTGPIDVLIVEDFASIAQAVRVALKGFGWEARPAATLAQAREMIRTREPNSILLDLRLGAEDGAALIPEARRIRPGCKVIVWSGDVRDRSDIGGADAVHVKAESTLEELLAELPPPRTKTETPE